MALTKKVNAGGVFLRILDGSIVRKSNTHAPGFEKFVTKNPQTNAPVEYFIERFDQIDGHLVKLERVDKAEHNVHGWKIHLLDDVEMLIDFKDNSSVTNRLLKTLPNIDLDKKLSISVWANTEDGKKKTAINFKQDGQNLGQFYNRENLPEAKPIGKTGKWNFADQEAFLMEETEKLAETINEHGKAALTAYQTSVADAVESGEYFDPYAVKVEEPTHTGGVVYEDDGDEQPPNFPNGTPTNADGPDPDDDSIPF